ncbi:MAG: DUF5117 domain-containing protein [Deltaproteobacteria bacterium]|nr:DUF5117 domain-containing protein [Deltaproteobacteria bacterium]
MKRIAIVPSLFLSFAALGARGPAAAADLKRYDEVITKDAVSAPGLFTVHRVKDRVFYEIPAARLGSDMLWYSEVAKAPPGVSCGGVAIGSRCVRWERFSNRVFLRLLTYEKRAEVAVGREPPAIQRAVEDASLPPIVMAFDVETEGRGGSVVIDVTKLLTSHVDAFSAEEVLNDAGLSVTEGDKRGSVDASRSYVEEVKAFPGNIEVRSVLTFQGLTRTRDEMTAMHFRNCIRDVGRIIGGERNGDPSHGVELRQEVGRGVQVKKFRDH